MSRPTKNALDSVLNHAQVVGLTIYSHAPGPMLLLDSTVLQLGNLAYFLSAPSILSALSLG
jgi:hypothetical protein